MKENEGPKAPTVAGSREAAARMRPGLCEFYVTSTSQVVNFLLRVLQNYRAGEVFGTGLQGGSVFCAVHSTSFR